MTPTATTASYEPAVAVGWKGLPTFVLNEAGVTTNAGGLVFVPYLRADGTLHNRKVFASNGRSWWEIAGLELLPFGLESLTGPPYHRALLVAEGESDSLALRAAFGWAVDALGIPGARTWRHEWLFWLEPYELVYVLADGDHAGDALADAIRVDRPDVRRVPIPAGEDARSLLQEHGPTAIELLLGQADEAAQEREALRSFEHAFLTLPSLDEYERFLREAAGTACGE